LRSVNTLRNHKYVSSMSNRSTAFLEQRRSLRRNRRLETWRRKDRWISIFAHLKSKSMQKRLVRQPWLKPAVTIQLSAAIIQKHMRGSLQRMRIRLAASIGMDQAAAKAVAPQKRFRGTIHARHDDWRHVHKMEDYEHKMDREVMFRDWVATRLQCWWRMQVVRWPYVYDRFTCYHIASSVIQRAWRERTLYLSNELGLHTEHSRRIMREQSQQQNSFNNSPNQSQQYMQQQRYMQQQQQQHSQQQHLQQPPQQHYYQPPPKRKPGAHSIQNAWRRYTSRRIFQYYRDLIRFRNAGNPALMLRSINPREASLFDEAAGIVLRFRLGGESFPPLIYYKIFTKSPLCDVNAFAPRNYVKSKQYTSGSKANNHKSFEQIQKEKQQHMSQTALELGKKTKTIRHGGDGRSKTISKKKYQQLKKNKKNRNNGNSRSRSIRVGRSEFATKYADDGDEEHQYNTNDDFKEEEILYAYERKENNGWRSVTLEILIDSDEDPKKRKIKKLGQRFHYSRQVRKEDKMIARKQKKRKWMMKMYREGLAKERPEVLAAAAGRGGSMNMQLEVDFDGDNWEEEAENLLEWSNELDFDSYLNEWGQIGTSTDQRGKVDNMIEELSRSSLLDDSM